MAESIRWEAILDTRQYERGFGRMEKKASGFQRAMGRLGPAIASGLAGGAIIAGVKKLTDAARESQLVAAQTEAVIKSTGGAAGLSAKQIGDLAGALSAKVAVDDEVIQSGANVLATFTSIKGDVFKGATAAAVDLAAAMNQGEVTADGLKSANIQLGKALNDPVKGISALTRVGVSFTQGQKDQIAAMVKAGDVAGAQRLILAELSKEFGGSAEAAATSGKKLSVAWGNAQETLGGLLLPAVERGQALLIGFIGWVDRNRGAATALGAAVAGVAGFIIAMSVATKVSVAVQTAARGAAVAWTAAQWLLNAALTANPIGLIVVGIALLVAALILAWKKSETFRDVVKGAFEHVKEAGARLWNAVKIGALTMVSIFLFAAEKIVGAAARAFGWVPGLGAKLKKAEEQIKAWRQNTQREIDRLHGKGVTVVAKPGFQFSPSFTRRDWLAARQAAGRMHEGGKLPGYGGGDILPILAEPGEAVVDKVRTRRYAHVLAAMGVPGFAAGGGVGFEGRMGGHPQRMAQLGQAHTGVARLLGNWTGRVLTEALKSLTPRIFSGSGSWRTATNYLERLGIPFSIMSTFRPGARTHASGSVSYHALNRAVDLGGNLFRIWQALDRSGVGWRELIYSGAPTYIGRGARKPIGRLDPVTLADHWNHVHVALGKGGIVRRPTMALLGERGPEAVVPLNRAAPVETTINVKVDLRGAVFTGPPQQFVDAVAPRLRQAIKGVQRSSGVPASQQLR